MRTQNNDASQQQPRTDRLQCLCRLHGHRVDPAFEPCTWRDLDNVGGVDANVEAQHKRHCRCLQLFLLAPLHVWWQRGSLRMVQLFALDTAMLLGATGCLHRWRVPTPTLETTPAADARLSPPSSPAAWRSWERESRRLRYWMCRWLHCMAQCAGMAHSPFMHACSMGLHTAHSSHAAREVAYRRSGKAMHSSHGAPFLSSMSEAGAHANPTPSILPSSSARQSTLLH